MEFVGKMCKAVLFHDNMEENKVKSYGAPRRMLEG
jgi:hypothetical protein